MKLRGKHRPHFSKRELGFLIGLIAAVTFLLAPPDYADSSVIKMPKPLPDIVKNYKSVKIWAGSVGINHTGLKVNQGDYITILAKGTINLWPARGKEYSYEPKALLLFQLGDDDYPVRQYNGPDLIEIKKDGGIRLGYRGSEMSRNGRPLNPERFADDIGSFYVDIIVWRTNDPKLIIKFLEEPSLAQPKDRDLKYIALEFRWRQQGYSALQEKKKEVEEIKKELSVAERKETSEMKREEKEVEGVKPIITPPVITPPVKEQIQEAKKPEKEKQIPEQKVAKKDAEKPAFTPRDKEIDKAKITTTEKQVSTAAQKPQGEKKIVEELTERLQNAMQAMKELEEMKKKLTEQEEKEAQLLARLKSMEGERSIQSKNLPVIALGYPKDGVSVDSEYVSLYGMAEHERGISKFEILINGKPIPLKDQRGLQLVPKDRKRIEFSERIRLREGQNTISIVAQSTEGLTNQKTLSVQLAKKREEVYAVVIGINKYRNLPSLKYAVNDAREFYRYLVEVNQVPKDHVWLLLDEEATLERLRTTLGTLLRRKAGKDDTVIIFLAGHGATETDASSPDGDGLEKYILPHNGDPKDLYSSAIPMSEVARIFQRISSERLVFIGDTCYSGASGAEPFSLGGCGQPSLALFWKGFPKGRVV
jgi:hypothetical protein